MILNIRENAEHSLYFSMIHFEKSLEFKDLGKQYDDGFVSKNQADGMLSFEIRGYNLPSSDFNLKIALQLIFQAYRDYSALIGFVSHVELARTPFTKVKIQMTG